MTSLNLNINSVLNKILKQKEEFTQSNSQYIDKGNTSIILVNKEDCKNQLIDNMERNKNIKFSNYSNSNYLPFKSANENYKNEIFILKSYINRINNEFRKDLKNDFPFIEVSCNENKKDDMESFIEFFNESVHRLINPDYLNPIFSIYDNHILNLENEIKNLKSSCKKYETIISDLVKENSEIREEISLKTYEQKELFSHKAQYDLTLLQDLDYLKSLEERLQLLSRENEILALSYQKVTKELFDFSCEYSEKHKENLEKSRFFSEKERNIETLSTNLESLLIKNSLNEAKILELSECLSRSEIERDSLVIEMQKIRLENQRLAEANLFYKNYIDKLCKLNN
jgi:hypothetical protein